MSTLDPTAYNRLFHRLRVQAMIQDLRRKFGDDEAFDIIAHAVRLENRVSDQTDAELHG
jgi:hypothetical protein